MALKKLSIVFLLTIFSAAAAFAQDSPFMRYVKQRTLKEPNAGFESICPIEKNPLARRVFLEYGSMFVATDEVRLPDFCIFSTASDVSAFHAKLDTKKQMFNFVEIELQSAAMKKLIDAGDEAVGLGLSITPLDGAVAARRTYADTVRIWNSRFYRALDYWEAKRRIGTLEADAARLAPTSVQIEKVMQWEIKGYWFSTGFSKSIFRSVAPPGTSQHLSLLAFDVVESANPKVRKILNKYGWYQTIRTDQPHFTFLGVAENELPNRGLRKIVIQGNTYWVPPDDAAMR